MGNVIQLNPTKGTTLRQAYRSALANAYNTTVSVGRLDRACAQTMVGFLSSAVIALRLAGDESWAFLGEGAAQRLHENWQLYEQEIPALAGALDAAA